jgi:ribonuclease P protein component
VTARVRGRAQFAEFRHGESLRSEHLSVRVAPSLRPGRPGVAFAIGRKVGPAVVRNRLRRRLRHVMQALEPNLDPSMVYLISARPSAGVLTFGEIEAAMRAMLLPRSAAAC